jgi:pimeloyl-ACP methyl ester carboxylesterase
VLVHGSGHGAWCWERLLPLLSEGSLAVDLPGRGTRADRVGPVGLADFADAVIEDVESAGLGDVALVVHSMGGLTAPLVAQRLGRRVRRCFFVAAVIAVPGEDALRAISGPMAVLGRILGRSGQDRIHAPRPVARWMLCNDLDPLDASFVLDSLCSEWTSIARQPIETSVLDMGITALTYVKLLRDRTLRPSRQNVFARRIGDGGRVVEIDSGHEVMISRPVELAAVLQAG